MTAAAMGCADLAAARRWAYDTVAVAPGWHQAVALTARARVAIAQASQTKPNETHTTPSRSSTAQADSAASPTLSNASHHWPPAPTTGMRHT